MIFSVFSLNLFQSTPVRSIMVVVNNGAKRMEIKPNVPAAPSTYLTQRKELAPKVRILKLYGHLASNGNICRSKVSLKKQILYAPLNTNRTLMDPKIVTLSLAFFGCTLLLAHCNK